MLSPKVKEEDLDTRCMDNGVVDAVEERPPKRKQYEQRNATAGLDCETAGDAGAWKRNRMEES